MKIAIITDVHANLEALDMVLKDIERNEITEIISLGDNIGYGPNPVEVLQKLYSKNVVTLEGNHDLAVVNPRSFADATDLAINALEWTRLKLWEASQVVENFEEILLQYLGTQSYFIHPDDPRIIFVHGSPGDENNSFDYILSPEDALFASEHMRKKDQKICFFGHTHQQALWTIDDEKVRLVDIDINKPIIFTEEDLEKTQLLINPGSVGQPRDGNPDSAYMIYERKEDQHIFTFKRIRYLVEKTIRKIYGIPELDNTLGDRLMFGA